MTKEQLRKESGYIEAKNKIMSYPQDFKFRVPLYRMSEVKRNTMEILLKDCCDENIIESISFDLDLYGNVTEEEYIRK